MKFNQKNFAIIQNKHIFVSANLKLVKSLMKHMIARKFRNPKLAIISLKSVQGSLEWDEKRFFLGIFEKKNYFSLNSGNFYVTLQSDLCPVGS